MVGHFSALCSPMARVCAAATFCSACFTARLFSTARAGKSSSCEITGSSGIDSGSTAIDSAGNPTSLDRCSRSTSACPCASAIRNRIRAATNWLLVRSSLLSTPCCRRCSVTNCALSAALCASPNDFKLAGELVELRVGQRRIQNDGVALVLHVQRSRIPVDFRRLEELPK